MFVIRARLYAHPVEYETEIYKERLNNNSFITCTLSNKSTN
jgi:hypothetical protein